MKRYFLSFGTLILTFIIGVYANGLALRVASQFTSEVDPQSVPPVSVEVIACGLNENGWWGNLQDDVLKNLPENPQGETQMLVITDPEKTPAELLKPKPTKSTKKR